jgi:hypothetical protein
MTHLAALYPESRFVGVELDGDNAALCARNVASWAERCEVIAGAIWDENGELGYVAVPGDEYGCRVGEGVGESGRPPPLLSIA